MPWARASMYTLRYTYMLDLVARLTLSAKDLTLPATDLTLSARDLTLDKTGCVVNVTE